MRDEIFFDAEKKYPKLKSYLVKNNFLVAWCDQCRRWHHHGQGAGHRVAHCLEKSAYNKDGYILEIAGKADNTILTDLKRKRPKGPPHSELVF